MAMAMEMAMVENLEMAMVEMVENLEMAMMAMMAMAMAMARRRPCAALLVML
jgi:hypothetical protein